MDVPRSSEELLFTLTWLTELPKQYLSLSGGISLPELVRDTVIQLYCYPEKCKAFAARKGLSPDAFNIAEKKVLWAMRQLFETGCLTFDSQ